MTSVEEDGVHVHEPCTGCGVAEAIDDGLCEECAPPGDPVEPRDA